jgi:hypothetical protein
LAHSLRRWPKALGIGSLVVSAAAIAGVSRLEVETDFTRNFRSGSPIVQSYAFVESNLGGLPLFGLGVMEPIPCSLKLFITLRIELGCIPVWTAISF